MAGRVILKVVNVIDFCTGHRRIRERERPRGGLNVIAS